MKSIITQFGLSGRGNYQFMHTLRNFIYVYVFGEKMGEISVGGISFPGTCEDGDTGFELVWKYYLQHRISTRGAPISVAIGVGLSFQGWLTDFKIETVDPAVGLSQFLMRLAMFPGRVIPSGSGTTTIDPGEVPPLDSGIVVPPPEASRGSPSPPIFVQ